MGMASAFCNQLATRSCLLAKDHPSKEAVWSAKTAQISGFLLLMMPSRDLKVFFPWLLSRAARHSMLFFELLSLLRPQWASSASLKLIDQENKRQMRSKNAIADLAGMIGSQEGMFVKGQQDVLSAQPAGLPLPNDLPSHR